MLALGLALAAASQRAPDFSAMFGPDPGCFIARELHSGLEVVFNRERCKVRFSPCSTFKIPHTVFALDQKVAAPKEIFKWDGKPKLRKTWEGSQTFEKAIENSVIWVYQVIERRLGRARTDACLKKLKYGNQDASAYPIAYWLMSSLKISANEQVDLLARLVREQWPFSKQAQRLTKGWLLVEKGPGYRYYGKTGSGIEGYPGGKMPAPGVNPPQLGWWVGWLERGKETWVFAANYSGPNAMGFRLQPKVRQGFVEMGLLPNTLGKSHLRDPQRSALSLREEA